MRVSLIVNPESVRGAARTIAGTVAATLRAAAPDLDATITADADETSRVARDRVQRGDDVVAVLGGDGTAHLVVQELAGSATALAVISGGSGNDLAGALGIPTEPVAAAAHIADAMRAGRRRRIDLGRVAAGEWFATVLCTGFDALVNKRAGALRWPPGRRRYDLAVLAELVRLRPRPVRVRTEAGDVELDATLVAVGNTNRYGGGMLICPDARPDDGLFDVTVMPAMTRRALLRCFAAQRLPQVTTLRARSVAITGSSGWPVCVDGETRGNLPVTTECEPQALTVVC